MGFIREDKTNGNNNGNNEIKTISSKKLTTVTASNIKLNHGITVNNITLNKDRRYYIEFLGSKKLCSLLTSEEEGNCIACSIGNYNIQAYTDSTNIMISITKVNEDDTTTTFTDLIIYEEEVKCLDSKYLETDLILQNSISLGRKGDIGAGSSAIGGNVIASGMVSHAEGINTTASGVSSHAEGNLTTASGDYSHTEGNLTTASGETSHAEGYFTTASGDYAHAEGNGTTATGRNSHAEGNGTTATGMSSHTEGSSTTASGICSHAEGGGTIASSECQHVQGKFNIEDTNDKYAHIVGNGTASNKRSNAHTLDWQGNAWFAGEVQGTNIPHTISSKKLATVPANDITLDNEITVNNISINKDRRYYIEFLGSKKLCSLLISEKQGNCIMCSIGNYFIQTYTDSTNIKLYITKINTNDTTTVTFTDLIIYEEEVKYLDSKYLDTDLVLQNSISLGRQGNIGTASSAIGIKVTASGNGSHAEGTETIASGVYSHAEGYSTTSSGVSSHAEGGSTTASSMGSHAEGIGTTASGNGSHAEGSNTIASSECQHVQGKFNIEDKTKKYAHIVGNGEYGKRSNAHTLDWEGNAWYSGEVYVGGKSQDDGKKLLSTADIYFDENGKLCITINGVTKKFTPDSE